MSLMSQIEPCLTMEEVYPPSIKGSDNVGLYPEETNDPLKNEIYECIRTIRDPEYPFLIGDLQAIRKEDICIETSDRGQLGIQITWNPMRKNQIWAVKVSLAIVYKLTQKKRLFTHVKVQIGIRDQAGKHKWDLINKQISDKERVSSAFENPKTRSWLDFMTA
eukprot:TRINITY_DN3562_c0_g3_i1.p1 TRINITY_DN3562_c0_g3~~TRINITY_DN3562_c0_g3_i1.p1  ORF type:complete len:163 (+),score=15.75 TRINITY_DN3562_c0_g3_i1:126-614(+)